MEKVGFGEMAIVDMADVPYGGAILKIEAGRQTDTVFHRTIGKIVYVMTGKLKATVMKEGRVSAIEVNPGTSFFVKPGLVYNFYAPEESIVIEFTDPKLYQEDVYCIFQGTKPKEEQKPEDVMKMTDEDKKELEITEEAPVEVEEKPKKPTKKKTTKRKTSKRKTKSKK